MKYPLRGEYDTAVRNLDKFVLDSVLKVGKPVKQTRNLNLLRSYNGGKAIVYEIQTNPKKYALKCWVEDLGDLKIRYKAIDEYLQTVNLPYFVDFSYKDQGILVNGVKFPIVRMEWVDGISFKRFLTNNIDNPAQIRRFADKFLEMVKELHKNNISHGDLQHGNIIVRTNGDICLIDYDGLYVPELSNEKDDIKGLDGYQHLNRKKLDKLSPKSDYFSELIIYLSLLAISEKPSYWKDIEKEERLLFSDKDFKDLETSHPPRIFAELKNISPEIEYFTLEVEKFCKESSVESLQPLENLATAYTGTKVDWDFASNVTPVSSPPPPISVDSNNAAWDTFTANNPNSNKANVPSSDPWNKVDTTNQSNVWNKIDTNNQLSDWDKLDGSQPPTKDTWDKFDRHDQIEQIESTPGEDIWNKFDELWSKVLKSASSIWNKVVAEINRLSKKY